MIDCPICHVPNDDDARFCAECGQRLQQPTPQPGPPPAVPPGTFTGAFNAINNPQPAPATAGVQPAPAAPQPTPVAPQPQMEAPPAAPAPTAPQMPPPGPGNKLHSPLLGGAPPSASAGPVSSENPELDRLRRMSKDEDNQQMGGGGGEPDQGQSAPPRKLRSPLLAQEEFDDEPENFGGPQGPTGGSTFPHRQKSGPLRSPLLGGEDENEPPAASGGGGSRGGKMRSPLLGGGGGGGDADYNDYPSDAPPARGGQTGGKPKLRSRMLSGGGGDDYGGGGGDYYDEEDDPYADEDNPNVLRSPLLAAKRSTGSHGTAPSPPVPAQPAPAPQAIMPQAPAPQPVPQPAPQQMSAPVQPPLPPVQPQPPQPPQPPQAAMPQPPAPPASASSQGGWAGAGQAGGQPGGPVAPPRPGGEPLQTDAGNQQAANKFQGTGTWYSEKGGTAGSDPQSLSGQQPNYPTNAAMGSGPLWNNSDTGVSGQGNALPPNMPTPGPTPGPSAGNPAMSGPGPGFGGPSPGMSASPGMGNPAALGGPGPASPTTPSTEYPVEDYSKLRRQPGEPTPASSVAAVPPAGKSTSGTGPLPHPGAGGFKDEADTARGGGKPAKRTGSRLLSNVAEEGADEEAFPSNNRFNQRSGPPMPGASAGSPASGGAARTVLGAVTAIVLLMKGYAVVTFMSTQFWQFMPFVADQIAGLILLVGLLIYCFMPRN